MTTIYESARSAAQEKSLGDQELSDLLVKAALNDPKVVAKGFDSSRVFALISVLLASPSSPRKSLVRRMKTCYLFQIERDGEQARWYADMKKKGQVGLLQKGEKSPVKVDVVITCNDKDMVDMATGKVPPQKLFAAKRIKVKGNLDRALNVEKILSHERQKLEGLTSTDKPKASSEGRWTAMKSNVKAKAKL